MRMRTTSSRACGSDPGGREFGAATALTGIYNCAGCCTMWWYSGVLTVIELVMSTFLPPPPAKSVDPASGPAGKAQADRGSRKFGQNGQLMVSTAVPRCGGGLTWRGNPMGWGRRRVLSETPCVWIGQSVAWGGAAGVGNHDGAIPGVWLSACGVPGCRRMPLGGRGFRLYQH